MVRSERALRSMGWRLPAGIALVCFVGSSGCSALCEDNGPLFCPGWLPTFFLDRLVCADTGFAIELQGRLLDAETRDPVGGTPVGGRTFTDGEETDFRPAVIDGRMQGPPSDEAGSFEQTFSVFVVDCYPVQSPRPYAEFPRPDRVEVIVARDGCEFSFLIDINEETVVDLDFPDGVIELIDPILVPECEDPDGSG